MPVKIKAYDTLTEAINDLKRQGYTANFNLKDTCLECLENGLYLNPDEFVIDETYRFEGETDPGDEVILYAISSRHHNLKGILVNAFGAYSDPVSSEMVEKLRYKG
ncbi:MAG TPA: hypothetical protein VNJ07_09620 [Chitinophagales bacterium]|nr:hypothetical protein [Chitinophagales bacterium]